MWRFRLMEPPPQSPRPHWIHMASFLLVGLTSRAPAHNPPLVLHTSTFLNRHDHVRHDVRSETQLELLPMVSRLSTAMNPPPTPRTIPVADDRGRDRATSDLELKILISCRSALPAAQLSSEDGIYRLGSLTPLNYSFIEQFHLKTIIYLGDA